MRLYFTLLLAFMLVVSVHAQDNDLPAPEFLLRQDNQLILIDGYTGDTTDIPLELDDTDRVEWSPDGKYLIVTIFTEGVCNPCINLYDVDANGWAFSEPIACDFKSNLFTDKDEQLLLITTDRQNDTLWLFDIETETRQKLYETTTGDEFYNDGLFGLEWSPSGKYLRFEEFESIMGGARSWMIVMNMDTFDHVLVSAPRTYYTDYNPIWSPDEKWFLIMLKEEYVTSGTLPDTNHEGDVYLVNPETGDQQRLTYTPATRKIDIHWTEDGQIAFTEVVMNDIRLSLEEAQAIEPVPYEEIIQPEEFDWENAVPQWSSYMQSPDPSYRSTYSTSTQADEDGNYHRVFIIGTLQDTVFETKVTSDVIIEHTLIGWRPTDIVYPQG